MILNGVEVSQGQHKVVKIKVGRLSSGTNINIFAHVYRANKPGKKILLLGGVHGDEINGVEIVRRSITEGYFDNLQQGTIIAIPLLNVFGFINLSRDVPGGKDVNRSFPGTSTGTLASRVANKLMKIILPNVDLVLDFHTGGDERYNYPQVRYTKNNAQAFEIAKVFNAPFTIQKPTISKSLRKVANDNNIPVVVYEGGESKRFDEFSIKVGQKGIENVMGHFGLIKQKIKDEEQSILINKTSWIRARDSGLFRSFKVPGMQIAEKEHLGVLNDVLGGAEKRIISNRKAYILGHNNAPVVNMGDALFNLGWYKEESL